MKKYSWKECFLDVFIPLISEDQLQFSNVIFGRGGQGLVRKGTYIHCEVAIKSITKEGCCILALREIQLLDHIRHPYIILIMAVCDTGTQDHIAKGFFDSKTLNEMLFLKAKETKCVIAASSKTQILK